MQLTKEISLKYTENRIQLLYNNSDWRTIAPTFDNIRKQVLKITGLSRRDADIKTVEIIKEWNKETNELRLNNRKVWSANELISSDIPALSYKIDGLVIDGGNTEASITNFHGEGGSGKSTLVLYMSICASAGVPFLNKFDTKKSRVLLIDRENGERRLKYRLNRILRGMDMSANEIDLYAVSLPDIILDKPNDEQKINLRDLLSKYKPDIVVIDSIVRFMEGEENSNSDVREIYNTIQEMNIIHSCSWILIHHANKMGGYRGASEFLNQCDNGFLIEMVDKHLLKFRLVHKKVRDDRLDTIEFQFVNTEDERLMINISGDETSENSNLCINCSNDIYKYLRENKILRFKAYDIRKIFLSTVREKDLKLLTEYEKNAREKHSKYSNNIIFDSINRLTDRGLFEKDTKKGYYKLNEEVL